MKSEILLGVREADRKWTPSLMGFVHVYENGRFLYEEKTEIKRLTKKDAIRDAENLRAEILELNGVKI